MWLFGADFLHIARFARAYTQFYGRAVIGQLCKILINGRIVMRTHFKAAAAARASALFEVGDAVLRSKQV